MVNSESFRCLKDEKEERGKVESESENAEDEFFFLFLYQGPPLNITVLIWLSGRGMSLQKQVSELPSIPCNSVIHFFRTGTKEKL